MLDVITGLIVLLVLLATFSVALIRQQRGEQRLADTRAAVRLAEQTATALQLGQSPPTPVEGAAIEIVPLQSAEGMPGRSWVRIRVTNNGRSATLVALAPTPASGGSK